MSLWADLDVEDRRGLVAGLLLVVAVLGGLVAYYLWSYRPEVVAVRFVQSAAEVSDCTLVSRLVVPIGNPADGHAAARTVATTLLATQDALRRMAATAGADTVLFTGGGVTAEVPVYRCRARP